MSEICQVLADEMKGAVSGREASLSVAGNVLFFLSLSLPSEIIARTVYPHAAFPNLLIFF